MHCINIEIEREKEGERGRQTDRQTESEEKTPEYMSDCTRRICLASTEREMEGEIYRREREGRGGVLCCDRVQPIAEYLTIHLIILLDCLSTMKEIEG